MFKKMILKLKNKIGDRFEPTIRKMCGIKNINETLDSIYYILNHGMDITQFPPATGLLRQVQLADTELLRIFHEICQKHHLTYWLDGGTLLGAARHHGFIPWDDDLDVMMTRDEFDRAREILPKEFKKYDIGVAVKGAIYIFISEYGCTLDVFPMDNVSEDEFTDINDLMVRTKKYLDFRSSCKSNERTDEKRREIMGNPGGANPMYYHGLEPFDRLVLHKKEVIFPLIKREFEGMMLYTPNNTKEYLEALYGDYMTYPRNGLLHHKRDGSQVYENSARYGHNMEELIKKLKSITAI